MSGSRCRSQGVTDEVPVGGAVTDPGCETGTAGMGWIRSSQGGIPTTSRQCGVRVWVGQPAVRVLGRVCGGARGCRSGKPPWLWWRPRCCATGLIPNAGRERMGLLALRTWTKEVKADGPSEGRSGRALSNVRSAELEPDCETMARSRPSGRVPGVQPWWGRGQSYSGGCPGHARFWPGQ
jgi:hypothetical protein